MIRFLLFLAIAGVPHLLEALSQDFGGTLPDKFDDRISGSTLDQPLPFESDLNTYDDGGIAAQPPPLLPADLDLSPDSAYLASLFSNEDDLDTSGDSLFSPNVLASTGPNSPDANAEAGYDESIITYEKVPIYTWPSDQNYIVFPFNCWKDNRDGFVCKDDHCQMAFVYAPGEIGTRYCCDRWDDLVEPKCVLAPVEDQLVA